MTIKNVVFDLGNVIVKWAPYEVIGAIFKDTDPIVFYEQIKPVWIDLNLGKINEAIAINFYQQQLNLDYHKLKELMNGFKTSQTPITGSVDLLQKLYNRNVSLYSITDNTKEIIEYHRHHSDFLQYFKAIVVSADVGFRKPGKEIYQYLLNQYKLDPSQTLFIDDLLQNVEGATSVGMSAFQFEDAKSCESKLIELGLL